MKTYFDLRDGRGYTGRASSGAEDAQKVANSFRAMGIEVTELTGWRRWLRYADDRVAPRYMAWIVYFSAVVVLEWTVRLL